MSPVTRFLSIAGVVLFAGLTTAVTWRVFTAPVDVPMGTATAYATFIGGPLIAALGFYKWARDKGDDKG